MKYLFGTLMVLTLMSCQETHQKMYQGTDALVGSEFIYQAVDVSFPSCHASTIVETEEGLLAAWFGGTREKDPDVGIWLSRFTSGQWSSPVEVANGIRHANQRYPTWNPVLYHTGSDIKLFYKVGPSPREWWGEVITSSDQGKSWSAPERLPDQIFGPIKNKPVKITDTLLLSPSSTEDNGWRIHLEISSDEGVTWTRSDALNDGKESSLIQPTILVHSNGEIQILCRSKNKAIYSSRSADQGQTWSNPVATDLPNPNSGFDAVTMRDGRHLLVYNHIACKPGQQWGDRNILNVAVSEDGKSWQAAVLLENDPDKDTEYSYPAVIQTADGRVHITYTWNRELIRHVVIDPARIKSREIVNGQWPTD